MREPGRTAIEEVIILREELAALRAELALKERDEARVATDLAVAYRKDAEADLAELLKLAKGMRDALGFVAPDFWRIRDGMEVTAKDATRDEQAIESALAAFRASKWGAP